MPDALLIELTKLARRFDDLHWFADRIAALVPTPQPEHLLPACTHIPATATRTASETQAATDALIGAIPRLNWTQSYNTKDAGFDQHYLDHYAYVNLVGPVGHFASDDMRISIGYWGERLHYPDHAHEPEEWYLMLAGDCLLWSDGIGERQVVAGEIAHHTPWQRHAAKMTPGPLLAAAFWRGDNLMTKSKFGN